jgi:hypothetical protein
MWVGKFTISLTILFMKRRMNTSFAVPAKKYSTLKSNYAMNIGTQDPKMDSDASDNVPKLATLASDDDDVFPPLAVELNIAIAKTLDMDVEEVHSGEFDEDIHDQLYESAWDNKASLAFHPYNAYAKKHWTQLTTTVCRENREREFVDWTNQLHETYGLGKKYRNYSTMDLMKFDRELWIHLQCLSYKEGGGMIRRDHVFWKYSRYFNKELAEDVYYLEYPTGPLDPSGAPPNECNEGIFAHLDFHGIGLDEVLSKWREHCNIRSKTKNYTTKCYRTKAAEYKEQGWNFLDLDLEFQTRAKALPDFVLWHSNANGTILLWLIFHLKVS